MTDYFVVFGDILIAIPTYLLNGFLSTLYWIADSGAAWVSMLCAGLIMRFVDQRIQYLAGYRPGRSGRETNPSGIYTAQITTGFVEMLWLISQWGMGAPVPWIGAAMWLTGTVLLLLLQLQANTLLWNIKSGILIYALAVLGSRFYLAYTAQLSATQWASLIGSSESAATVIANTRGNVTSIILWALWLVIPLGYFAMLFQQVLINPMSLIHPLTSASDLIERYRTRR